MVTVKVVSADEIAERPDAFMVCSLWENRNRAIDDGNVCKQCSDCGCDVSVHDSSPPAKPICVNCFEERQPGGFAEIEAVHTTPEQREFVLNVIGALRRKK